jgi:alcohol dehydrogenase class IV
MSLVNLQQPKRIVFGAGALQQAADIADLGVRRALIVTSTPIVPLARPLVEALESRGVTVTVYGGVDTEPSVSVFEAVLDVARSARPDAVVGIGGGSPLDTAKAVAALHDSEQGLRDVFGIGLLKGRRTHLVCLPTTAGTGSEVSPNAIFLDETDLLKKGVISPFLVPDAAYVDPLLTHTVPAPVTAATGVDAMIHCLEAYTNKFAHPTVDLYALQGIRLIAAHLSRAVKQGDDAEAREKLALGALYGGLCLGPVNTAAVHALAYPLGGEFKVSHGVSTALLLAPVTEFNIPAAPGRYADVARAMGVNGGGSDEEVARRGLERIMALNAECGLPSRMSEVGVPEEALPRIVESGMTVTRLLKNNPREVTAEDAERIYRAAL